MKKYFRVFVITHDGKAVVIDSKSNWYDSLENAEGAIENYYFDINPEFTYTILPVYDKE